MIVYRHNKTGYIVERDVNAIAFRGKQIGDEAIQLPKNIVEESSEWERVYPKVDWYPATLVEPLFNCRLQHIDTYVDRLFNYKNKIQNS
jgi:hypothetical protein